MAKYFFSFIIIFSSLFFIGSFSKLKAETFELRSISVEGNNRLSNAAVANYSQLNIGAAVSSQDLNEAYKSIIDTELFKSVVFERNRNNLLIKVDIVPTSLALAQAAIESGWGTSRYLREGNAIYGQYTFDKKKGISPKKIQKGKNFYIKKFSNLSESTRSYLKNINTHRAYEKFRQERKKLRMNGEILSGKVLSSYLESYSERRKAYVDDVRNLIESNNFMKFDYSNNLPN